MEIMNITRFKDADRYEPEPNWKRVSLCGETGISIEHFTKPPRHASPKHDHPNAQVLVVLEGRIKVETDADGEHVLEAGDSAYFPPGEAHIVTNALNVPSAGIDIFVPGRSFDFWLKRNRPT